MLREAKKCRFASMPTHLLLFSLPCQVGTLVLFFFFNSSDFFFLIIFLFFYFFYFSGWISALYVDLQLIALSGEKSKNIQVHFPQICQKKKTALMMVLTSMSFPLFQKKSFLMKFLTHKFFCF